MNCYYMREYSDPKTGNLYVSQCHVWTDCPHQPVTEYIVMARTGGDSHHDVWSKIGQYHTRQEALSAEAQYGDFYTEIVETQHCKTQRITEPRTVDLTAELDSAMQSA